VNRQSPMPIRFEAKSVDEGSPADLLVEYKLLVELKSVEQLAPVHSKLALTYLPLLSLLLCLPVNFGAGIFKEGIKRIMNNHPAVASSRLYVQQSAGSSSTPE
jgi:GxxExxY protein